MWELYRTRPWGRVQPESRSRTVSPSAGFNPHPPVGAGATCLLIVHYLPNASFNPHPPVGAGATGSISMLSNTSGFQSSPARGGGCNLGCQGEASPYPCFNPHPPVGAGATGRSMGFSATSFGFQSSPARGGGCNQRRAECRHLAGVVSILTRPWGRVQRFPSIFAARVVGGFNPHPPVGAGATCEPSRLLAELPRFNPHPPVGAGATIGY